MTCVICNQPSEGDFCAAHAGEIHRIGSDRAEAVSQYMADRAVAEVRADLAEILDLMVEVTHYLLPGSAPADTEVHSKAAHAPSVVNEQVVDLLDTRDKDEDDPTEIRTAEGFRVGVFPLLGMWTSLVQAELFDLGRGVPPCCPMSAHTLSGELSWLTRYAETVIELHPDFPGEIRRVRNELRKACRIRPLYEPTCSSCGWKMEPQEGEETPEGVAPAWWRCTGCGASVIHDAEVKRLMATQPHMTLKQISAAAQVPLRTLHNWRNEGRFLPVGRDMRGRDLYELALVQRAADSAAKREGKGRKHRRAV